MTSVAKYTILNLLEDSGCAFAEYHNRTVRNLKVKRAEVDEIWQFCYAKEKNVPADKQGKFSSGDVRTTTGIDSDTKLTIFLFTGQKAKAQGQ